MEEEEDEEDEDFWVEAAEGVSVVDSVRVVLGPFSSIRELGLDVVAGGVETEVDVEPVNGFGLRPWSVVIPRLRAARGGGTIAGTSVSSSSAGSGILKMGVFAGVTVCGEVLVTGYSQIHTQNIPNLLFALAQAETLQI